MGYKINEILKELAKKQKLEKHKFQKGKTLKIPSLLGTTPTKVIKPKYVSLPLTGSRVNGHIAIGLINASRSKKSAYKKSLPRNIKPFKISKEHKEIWKSFGRGVPLGQLKKHIHQYDREYLYGYAKDVIANKREYKRNKEYVRNARIYLLVHKQYGAPDLTKQFFEAKYGRAKLHRLADDSIYQQLLKLRKVATTKGELRKIEGMINSRRKQLSVYKSQYYYLEYRQSLREERWKNMESGAGEVFMRYEYQLDRMRDPSIDKYGKYLTKEMSLLLNQTAGGTDEEFFKHFYAKYKGVNPGFAIGSGREKYAYEKLITGMKETGLNVPLHSTNLHALKNPRLIHAMKIHLAKDFTQEEINEYIKNNLTNPENLSRSGRPDPGVDRRSLHGYERITPRGLFPGQEAEIEITKQITDIEREFDDEYEEFIKTDKAARKQFNEDIKGIIPPADIRSHFQMVLEHKKQMLEQLKASRKTKLKTK